MAHDPDEVRRQLQEERKRVAARFTATSPIQPVMAYNDGEQENAWKSPRQMVWRSENVNEAAYETPVETSKTKMCLVENPKAAFVKSASDQEMATTKGLGWKTAPFIFGGEIGERTGSFGLQMNLINFLLFEMNMTLVTAANTVTNFFAITCLATLGGAFLADAYLGRFRTIVASCAFYLAGLLVFTVSASVASFRPAPCDMIQRLLGECEKANSLQMGVLYMSLGLQCLGSGGVRPCVAPFGADQFDQSDKKHSTQLRHYFNWYYMSIGVAFLASLTVTVYIQDSVSWGWGAGVCAMFMAAGLFTFLLGSPFYKRLPATGSPLTSMVQVLVAALRKHKLTLPDNPDYLFEARKYQDKEILGVDQELLAHTDNFRYLDKAAIMETVDEEPDEKRRHQRWRLASVHQVEELKILLRMVPIWLCGVTVATVIVQSGTFTVQQANRMDRHLGRLVVPPPSMGVFSVMALLIFVPIYDLVIIKVLRKLTGHPKGLTYLQRIGVGLFLSIVSMVVAALVEAKRRRVAYEADMVDQMIGSALPISAFWLVPQYVLAGFSESFLMIGELEFFYDEAPISIRSMSNAFLWTALGVGSFLSSVLVSVIQDLTKVDGRGGWLQDNLNRGHLDRFYWFLAALTSINCVAFCYVSRWYVYKNANLYGYDSSPDDENVRKVDGKRQIL